MSDQARTCGEQKTNQSPHHITSHHINRSINPGLARFFSWKCMCSPFFIINPVSHSVFHLDLFAYAPKSGNNFGDTKMFILYYLFH